MSTKSKALIGGAIVALMAIVIVWMTVGSPPAVAQGGAAAQQQGPPPQRVAVTVTQVKPEMLQTWQDVIKNEAIPAQRKAGVAWRHTFANGPFGQGFTFVTVQPVTNYAQYDQPGAIQRALGADGAAKYNAKLRPTLVSTHTIVQTLQPNESIQSNSTTPSPLIVVQNIQVLSGKGAEFESILKSDYLPNYRKAGVTNFFVFTTNFGAPNSLVTTVRPISTYAELDQQPGLLARAVGAEAAQKINARRNALIASIETEVYRFVPELSFGMPARTSN